MAMSAGGEITATEYTGLVKTLLKCEIITSPQMGQFYFRNSANTLDEQLFVMSQQLNLSKMPVLKNNMKK